MKLTFVILSLITVSSALAQTPEEINLPDAFSGIPKFSKPPAIDGDLAEWNQSSAIFLSDKSTQPLDDCSGVFYMMWDDDNLYFAAKVYDDELVQGVTGANIWEEDDVQFDLDTDKSDKNVFAFNDDDFQIGFSPGDFAKEKPEIWGWNPGSGRTMDGPENAEIASSGFDGGWIIEARIGADEFNADLTGISKFEEGMKIGFGRCINDYDKKSGEGGISSGGAWQDTSKMYDVELMEPLSVQPRQKLTTSWGSIKRISKDGRP
jgi:hypothetical protein